MAKSGNKKVRTMDEAFHELLEADTHTESINDALRRDAPMEAGPTMVPVSYYTSRKYHELEKERLWAKTWQFAAHEDDFPNVGDVVPYDIATQSFIVVRTAEDEYKAYYNACLHRGRKLREERATALDELRCAFHGWSWSLDGSLKQVPCGYDFSGMNREEQSLPEVKLGRWGRFIFINPDMDCEPLEDYLGDLESQFEVLPHEKRYKSAHVAKVVPANWKVVQEAFMESYHVLETHPQILTGGAHDICTKYDEFGNYSRAIRCGALEGKGTPEWEALPLDGKNRLRHPLNGWIYEDLGEDRVLVTTPKGLSGTFTSNAEWIEGDLKDANAHLCIWVGGKQLPGADPAVQLSGSAIRADGGPDVVAAAREILGEDASPRALGAEVQRQMLKQTIPSIADSIPDIELSSSFYLTVFPNWHPWGSFNPLVYRFRPNGDNHEECLMDVIFLSPIPENGDYQPVSEVHFLEEHEDWVEAPELGMLAKVFGQDLRNIPFVYAGLKATAREHVRLADYNELKIRHFYKLYEERMGEGT